MKNLSLTLSTRQAWTIIAVSLFIGFLISTFWSASLVDSDIGDPIANTLLGFDAKETPISSSLVGVFFALATGIAGTFTACNICAFSAIAPLAAHKRSVGNVLKPLMWLSLGLILVAAVYGAVGALIGTDIPQLSNARLGDPETGLRVRLLQSMIVFCAIGLIYIVWGLMILGILRNPFKGIAEKYSWAPSLFMGMTIGAFLIGRPFSLFRKMFEYAAETHNPLFGSLAFVLQGLGNILIMVALFLLLIYGTRSAFERWMTAKPNRAKKVTATALLIAGAFFFSYWGPRMLARNDLLTWPFFDWDTHTIQVSR